MKQLAIIIAVSAALLASPGWAGGNPRHEAGIVSHGAPELPDNSKEPACDCCRKCQAAKSSMPTRKEEGKESDGCEDCCTRCGKELKPSTEEIPPEIIRKSPPDIKQKE